MSVDLYNLDPVMQLLGLGLLVAGLPMAWFWHRHRHAVASQRLKALTILTLTLTFELVLVGAFTRLTDSGLGCPDWPGCYGSASPWGAQAHISLAQAAMPTGPVTHSKAWIEMLHRYLASGVGVLILVLCAMTWRLRQREPSLPVHPWWPTLSLFWVCLQGAFGALTVTMKLFPLVVTLHLMLALGLLSLLTAQAVRYQGWQSVALPSRVRQGLWLAMALLWLQIALGGWVSTNYAVLACTGFPACNGQWWPEFHAAGFALWRELGHAADGQVLPFASLVSIHVVHRSLAWLVLAVLTGVAWRMRQTAGLRGPAHAMLALATLQLLTGVSNVVLGWPLLAAVLHTAGAAALVVVLTWALALSRGAQRTDSLTLPTFDTRPVA